MKESPWQSVGVGCLTLIGAFFAAILLAISVIGIRLLLLLVVLAVLAYMFGAVYVRYEVGRMILSKFGKENTGRLWVLVTGVLVVDVLLGILTFIPFIGGFVGILTMFIALWGLGAIVMNKYNSLYKKEKVVKEKKEVKK